MRRPDLSGFLMVSTVAFLMSACAQFPTRDHGPAYPVDVSQVPNAVPRNEPKSPYGNPSSYMVDGHTYHVLPSCADYHERGIASWYGSKFHGGRTSDGETYDMYAMTAASKELPLPCYVRVVNLENSKSVIVKVNDRGPFIQNRIIDLSYAAAARIGMLATGTALVDVSTAVPAETPPTGVSTSNIPLQSNAPQVNVAVSKPQIFVQVGAFANRRNAVHVLQRLQTASVKTAFIVTEPQNGIIFYKVRIGPLLDVSHVDALTGQLRVLGFPDAQVIIP
jgi:peptidoglycan lytic transglycosylase